MIVLKRLSAFLVGLFSLVAGLFNSVEATNKEVAQKKVLIVYFSHTGNTKLIAEKVRKELADANYQVDLYRIEPMKEYPEYGDELRDLALNEANDDSCRPGFKVLDANVQDYDWILIGTPVWWYKALKIMLSFLEKQNFSDKEVRFFITHGGGPGTCISDMKTACKGANFGENVDIYCNSPGNGKVDYNETISWIKKIKKEMED